MKTEVERKHLWPTSDSTLAAASTRQVDSLHRKRRNVAHVARRLARARSPGSAGALFGSNAAASVAIRIFQ